MPTTARSVSPPEPLHGRLGLDDIVTGNRRGPLPMRWIYLHALRELAQHCGHADILREQVLATRSADHPVTVNAQNPGHRIHQHNVTDSIGSSDRACTCSDTSPASAIVSGPSLSGR